MSNLLETILVLVGLLTANNWTAERLVLLACHHHRCITSSETLHLHHLLLTESADQVIVVAKLAVTHSELSKLLLESSLVSEPAVRAEETFRWLIDTKVQSEVVSESVWEVHTVHVHIHIHITEIIHVHIHAAEVVVHFRWSAWD